MKSKVWTVFGIIVILSFALMILTAVLGPKSYPEDTLSNNDTFIRGPFESRKIKRSDFTMEFETEIEGETTISLMISPFISLEEIVIQVEYFDKENNSIKKDVQKGRLFFKARSYRLSFNNTDKEKNMIYRYEATLIGGKRI